MKFIPPFTAAPGHPQITTSLTKALRKAGNLKHLPVIAGATVLHQIGNSQVIQTHGTHDIFWLRRTDGVFKRLSAHDDGSLRTDDHVEPAPAPAETDADGGSAIIEAEGPGQTQPIEQAAA